MNNRFPTLLIVPTGIGCELGGYAGDAIPAARLLSAASDCLITHPNVMNGATLFWSDSRIQYVEGYALDRFSMGEFLLRPVRKQQVGLLLDAGIEEELQHRHLQVAEACRASLGLNIGPVVSTEAPLEIELVKGRSGTSWGLLDNVDVLLKTGEKLKQAGATAIAVITRFPDDLSREALDEYRHGVGVDSIAGAEAVISHLLVRHLGLPCAHAPALTSLPLDPELDPRAAGEELGHTFLTCVLVGLSRAPDLLPLNSDHSLGDFLLSDCIHADHLGAVVAPNGALGGEAVLACLERNVPLIVVSNPNLLRVTSQSLRSKGDEYFKDNLFVLHARNYVEAAGLILLLREGINVDSLYRPLSKIMKID